MMFPSFWSDATKATLAIVEASMENAQAAQETFSRQMSLASRMENPWAVKWTGSPVPLPVLTFQGKGAETAREAFHLMSDANISSWESAAKVYAAMPSWAKAPYKVPGEFWSKWFDQVQKGEFKATFTAPSKGMFDQWLAAATPVPPAANETAAKDADFKLESPSEGASSKPELFTAAPELADELTVIKGIGAKLQKTLNDLGVYHFAQIASWTPENLAWLDDRLAFKGRIQREAWVEQAQNILKQAA